MSSIMRTVNLIMKNSIVTKMLVILILLSIFVLCFSGVIVKADGETNGKLNYENFEIECVYDNSMSITFLSDGEAFEIKMDDFPIEDEVKPPFNAGYKFFYKESETAKKVLDEMQCPTFIQGTLFEQTTLTGGEVHNLHDLGNLTAASAQFEVYFNDIDREDFTTTKAYDDFLSKQLVGTLRPACFSAELTDKFNKYKEARKKILEKYGKVTDELFKQNLIYKSFYEMSESITDDGCLKMGGKFIVSKVDLNSRIYKRAGFKAANGMPFSFKYHLQSERVYFNDYVTPIEEIGFKAEGIQATSTPEYVRIMKYLTPSKKTILLAEKDSIITPISTSILKEFSLDALYPHGKVANYSTPEGENVRYMCFSESVKSMTTNKNKSAYTFSSIRHSMLGEYSNGYLLLAPKDYTDSDKYKNLIKQTGIDYLDRKCRTEGYTFYVETELQPFSPPISTGTSICKVIPETAVWIALIINYLQLLVPIFLIVLTAIDISKIVINGNLEEELPKRRKLIIVRFIVAVSFFFIPLIIKVVINDSYGTDFGDVSCLFNYDDEELNGASDKMNND